MQNNINKDRHHTFTVRVESARRIKITAWNSVLDKAVVKTIKTRRYKATRRTLQGDTIVNDANFESALLTLKVGTEDVVEQVPVELIEQATAAFPGKGYELNYAGIDWNTSYVEIPEGVTLNTGAVFEFTVVFQYL